MSGSTDCVRRSLLRQLMSTCCFQRPEDEESEYGTSSSHMTSPYLSVPALMGRPKRPRIRMEVVMLLQGKILIDNSNHTF